MLMRQMGKGLQGNRTPSIAIQRLGATITLVNLWPLFKSPNSREWTSKCVQKL